jgi:hypothetical protein
MSTTTLNINVRLCSGGACESGAGELRGPFIAESVFFRRKGRHKIYQSVPGVTKR